MSAMVSQQHCCYHLLVHLCWYHLLRFRVRLRINNLRAAIFLEHQQKFWQSYNSPLLSLTSGSSLLSAVAKTMVWRKFI